MVRASYLNGFIFFLAVLGVIEIFSIAQQHSSAEDEKFQAKQKLDFLLHQLNAHIKEFNHSVSSLRANHVRSDMVADVRIHTAPTTSKPTAGLFSPTAPIPTPKKTVVTHTRPVFGPSASGKKALLFTMDSISSCKLSPGACTTMCGIRP